MMVTLTASAVRGMLAVHEAAALKRKGPSPLTGLHIHEGGAYATDRYLAAQRIFPAWEVLDGALSDMVIPADAVKRLTAILRVHKTARFTFVAALPGEVTVSVYTHPDSDTVDDTFVFTPDDAAESPARAMSRVFEPGYYGTGDPVGTMPFDPGMVKRVTAAAAKYSERGLPLELEIPDGPRKPARFTVRDYGDTDLVVLVMPRCKGLTPAG